MSKLIYPGVVKPNYPPPIGSRADCPRCSARIEVELGEPYLAALFEDPKSYLVYAGWLITCCACGYPRVPIKQTREKKVK